MQVAAEGCTFKGKKLTMVWQKSVLSELNASTEQENMGAAIKQLVHTDLKMNATGENVPNKNNPVHAIVPRPELEEDHKSEETDPKYLCSVDLQNQDTAATAEVSFRVSVTLAIASLSKSRDCDNCCNKLHFPSVPKAPS